MRGRSDGYDNIFRLEFYDPTRVTVPTQHDEGRRDCIYRSRVDGEIRFDTR